MKGKLLGEASKEIGASWKELSEEEKKVFHKQAEEDKKRFEQEMENYVPEPEKPKKRKTLAKYLKVQGVRSDYILFSIDARPNFVKKYPNASNTELIQIMSKEWNKISSSKKKKYQKLALDDKNRYEKELANAIENNPELVKKYEKENSKKRKRILYGVKATRSSYILFTIDARKTIDKSLKATEITKLLSKQWNELNDNLKKNYHQKHLEDKIRFQKEFDIAKKNSTTQNVTNENINDDQPKVNKKVKKISKKNLQKKTTKKKTTKKNK